MDACRKSIKTLHQHGVEQVIHDVLNESAGSEVVESDNTTSAATILVQSPPHPNSRRTGVKTEQTAPEKAKPLAQTQKVVGEKRRQDGKKARRPSTRWAALSFSPFISVKEAEQRAAVASGRFNCDVFLFFLPFSLQRKTFLTHRF